MEASPASSLPKGTRDLSHLYWVSTLEERPALGVLSVSKHFGTKVALWCPRPRKGLYNSIVSSMECLKHQGNLALTFCVWCPHLRKGLL